MGRDEQAKVLKGPSSRYFRDAKPRKVILGRALAKVKTLLSQGVSPDSMLEEGQPVLHWVIIRMWNFRLDGNEKKRNTMRKIGQLLIDSGAILDVFIAVCLGLEEEAKEILGKRPELIRRRFPLNGYLLANMAGFCGEGGPELRAVLKRAKREAPAYDWDKGEDDLYQAAVDEISRLAKRHKKVEFSSFAFDCDPQNSSMLVKLNAASNVIDSEWNPVGDYSHSNSGEWGSDARVADLLSESAGSAAKAKTFMKIAARVALRLEDDAAFDVLRKTDDFALLVTEHDEPLKKAVSRLERIRKAAPKKAAPKKAAPKKAAPKKAALKKTAANKAGLTHLEFSEGTSKKFWQISLKGKEHTVCYGRIGSVGQKKTKSFSTVSLSAADAKKLISQKKKKGYSWCLF